MQRRDFLMTTAAAVIAGAAGSCRLSAATAPLAAGNPLDELLRGLLREWCDRMIRLQLIDASRPESHGAIECPACGFIHGRCGDAVLPFMAMAAHSGEARYLEAALRVAAWTKNVDVADGSWTNDLDPNSWKGTTVFTAIAFAEALEWHGGLLDQATRAAWRERLQKAGEFIFRNVNVDAASQIVSFAGKPTNVNYGVSGAYALALLGHLLDDGRFRVRASELAAASLGFFTPQNHLLAGEGYPIHPRSPKGCRPVDLGYNVEESLPNLVHYALLTGDKKALDVAVASFKSHLEFMLPDGGWDNSWGTRSFKWTYWGSRTSDGCQAALIRLANRDPVFLTAALRNAEQFRACTHEGLLHGGPHYASHQVKPCVHHTFAHAKVAAAGLHHLPGLKTFPALPPLPRAIASGVKHFPEIEVSLASIGPWRATFSGYDWIYKNELFQALGGAPGMLWHEKLGPVLCASLARYFPAEPANMQLAPDGEDFPLTVRVEHRDAGGAWFTNLHDTTAKVRHEATPEMLRFVVETRILSAAGKNPVQGPCRFEIIYTLTRGEFVISARPIDTMDAAWSLVIPVIARSDETVTRSSPTLWNINKSAGQLIVKADSDLNRISTKRDRVFNLVPGFEALPLAIASAGGKAVECTLGVA